MYGQSPSRTFSLPDHCQSPITPLSAPTLVPKWVVKTDKTVTASPSLRDGVLYVGDWSGTMYALDADDGSEIWRETVDPAPGAAFGPVVSSAAVAKGLVIFGAGPTLYALDADDGSEVWSTTFDSTSGTPVQIESSPVVHQGFVYVGIDNHNTGGTGVPGGLLKVSIGNGLLVDKFEPELGADDGCGGMWSSPVIDTAERVVYIATANCPDQTVTWTPYVEAVTALDLDTLDPVWSFQPDPQNLNDHDFGATPNLFVDEDGRHVLGAGRKDGVYYALDPATGDLLWETPAANGDPVQENFAIGGFIGSPAVYRGNVFGGTAIGGPPYYHALAGTDGSRRWAGAQAPSYAASAAVNGVVFHGALDNVLRAYHADTGAVLWAEPLLGPISSGAAVVGDSVYVGSGTSSSDACRKEFPDFVNQLCVDLFDEAIGSTGGIHAFELAPVSPLS